MSETDNRAALAHSEKHRIESGDPEGNRHQRRLAARLERQERKRLSVVDR